MSPDVALSSRAWVDRIDPKNLTMGLDLDNSGRIDQLMQGPLGVDVNNDGIIDVVITPEQLRQFIMEEAQAQRRPPPSQPAMGPPRPQTPPSPPLQMPPVVRVAPPVRMEAPPLQPTTPP